ncbi:hypothetical protein ACFP2T_35890 [Plantactinospora solaniradicis]|uniref:Uncharacterized protein n=1 Tax=Plantactinospora solaniradicis TaxID=1723736 RepID=A0ABW1KKX4_9ACTN
MKILSADLSRLCYNAIQFSAKDSSLGGVVALGGSADLSTLTVWACDDYVALADHAPAEVSEDFSWFLALKEVKDLEKTLRDYDGEIFLSETAGHLDLDEHDWPLAEDPPDFQPVVNILSFAPNPVADPSTPFAIRAARFTKFRLLRTPQSPSTKDEYPVDFLWDGDLLRWKCGPTLRGVVAPLHRQSFESVSGEEVTGIEDLFSEEREEVLW